MSASGKIFSTQLLFWLLKRKLYCICEAGNNSEITIKLFSSIICAHAEATTTLLQLFSEQSSPICSYFIPVYLCPNSFAKGSFIRFSTILVSLPEAEIVTGRAVTTPEWKQSSSLSLQGIIWFCQPTFRTCYFCCSAFQLLKRSELKMAASTRMEVVAGATYY